MGLAVALAATAVPQRGLPLPIEWEESVALASEGSFDDAEDWVERALVRAPDDLPLKLAASDFYRRRGQPARERELLQDVLGRPDPEPDLVSIGHQRRAQSFAVGKAQDPASHR